jgi:hypothetical protein
MVLRIFVVVAALVFMLGAVKQIRNGRLLLKYALLWFVLALLAVVGALWPRGLYVVSDALGFKMLSNFVLFVGMLFLLAICLSLSLIVSKQAVKIKTLVQELAILEHRVLGAEGEAAAQAAPSQGGEGAEGPTGGISAGANPLVAEGENVECVTSDTFDTANPAEGGKRD